MGGSGAGAGVSVGGRGVGVGERVVGVGEGVAVDGKVGVTVGVGVAGGRVVGLAVGVKVGAAAARRVRRGIGVTVSALLLKIHHSPTPEPNTVKPASRQPAAKRLAITMAMVRRCFCFKSGSSRLSGIVTIQQERHPALILR